VVVAKFKAVFTHLHAGTKENHEKISYGRLCSGRYSYAGPPEFEAEC
jgi:hypothetical protein